jgi:membrane-associated protein
MLHQLLDILRHLDVHLAAFAGEHGVAVYALLFGIIFAETGLVFMPFLPGDSLLFTIGALSTATTERPAVFNPWLAFVLLTIAAILGDFVNYHAGKFIGPRVFSKTPDPSVRPTMLERCLNRKHLERAHAFYGKYGGKAVILGRFVPIARTFIPFVAGAGAMHYGRFVLFNIVGAIAWVGICVLGGVMFGHLEVVKKHFELVVVGIILVSLLPLLVEFVLAKRRQKLARGAA